MAVQRLDLRPGFDVSRIKNQSIATLINCYSEIQAGKGAFPIVGLPGQVAFASIDAPVRGLYVAPDGTFYAVGGNNLYSIGADGAAERLNTIPGGDMVEMAANRTQLGICAAGRLFVWYPQAAQLAEVTNANPASPDFKGASTFLVINGIGVAGVPGSDQFQISAPLDLATWPARDFATAESQPDELVAVRIVQGEPWFLGAGGFEVWPNTGAANFPFERRGLSQDVGLVSRDSAVNVGESLMFLGRDRGAGGLSVYTAAGGYQPARVSSHAVDRLLERSSAPERARAYSWRVEGHHFYCLTLDAGTVAYDTASREWHQQAAGVWPFEGQPLPARARCSAAFGGRTLLGDDVGRIFALSFDSHVELDGPMVRELVTGPMGGVGGQVSILAIGLEVEAGLGTLTADPEIVLSLSRDGGHTYDLPRSRRCGLVGRYRQTVTWNRLGRSGNFVARFRMTDGAPFHVTSAWADVEPLALR